MASHSANVANGEQPGTIRDAGKRHRTGDEKSELLNGEPPDVKRDTPTSETGKVAEIETACGEYDLAGLRNLSTGKGGLLTDELRRKAWPLLLAVDLQSTSTLQSDWHTLPTHKDERQVQLDVDRAFVYYPSESDSQLSSRKASLQTLITAVLRRHPYLCYFQGYHDIVQVFLLVFGSSPPVRPPKESTQPPLSVECIACVERLSLLRIRDFMLPTLDGLNAHMMLLPNILEAADKELYSHVRQAHRSYSLSGMLTLYAHEIQEYGVIARLFDFLLATDAVMSVYLFVAIILSRRDTVFEIEPTDTDMLLHILSKLPQPIDLEALIAHSLRLYSQYPPQKLPHGSWRRISSNSVLKTCRCGYGGKQAAKKDTDSIPYAGSCTTLAKQTLRSSVPFEDQTLSDGEACFHRQAAELKRAEDLDKLRKHAFKFWMRYRKPARSVALFSVAAALAYIMRPGTGLNATLADTLRFVWGTWPRR